jgi:exonuclease III
MTYTITDNFRDAQENILGIKVSISGCEFWIISIYGPNNNDREFFNCLGGLIDRCGTTPVIIGGDWNTTVSTIDSPNNIDIYGMQRPPSHIRSEFLNQICTRYSLTDPFRALHPEARDFTYIPRTGRQNRSRLDYFLISDCIILDVKSVKIEQSLTCSLFDHKPVFVNFGKSEVNSNAKIFSSTMKHHLFDSVAEINITDTY